MFRHTTIVAFVILLVVCLTVGCKPSEEAVEEAVQAALAATQEALPSQTIEPTQTTPPRPSPTVTTRPTTTPTTTPTKTPRPTPKPSLTPTPWPTIAPEVMTASGNCVDEITGNSYIYLHAVYSFLLEQKSFLDGVVDVNDGDFSLVLEYSYTGSDWLFIDKLVFNVDGEVITLVPDYTDGDVLGNGNIYEHGYVWIDKHAGLEYDQFYKIAYGEKVLARYSGSEGSYDHELTVMERGAIRYALVAFDALEYGALSVSDIEERCPY